MKNFLWSVGVGMFAVLLYCLISAIGTEEQVKSLRKRVERIEERKSDVIEIAPKPVELEVIEHEQHSH